MTADDLLRLLLTAGAVRFADLYDIFDVQIRIPGDHIIQVVGEMIDSGQVLAHYEWLYLPEESITNAERLDVARDARRGVYGSGDVSDAIDPAPGPLEQLEAAEAQEAELEAKRRAARGRRPTHGETFGQRLDRAYPTHFYWGKGGNPHPACTHGPIDDPGGYCLDCDAWGRDADWRLHGPALRALAERAPEQEAATFKPKAKRKKGAA